MNERRNVRAIGWKALERPETAFNERKMHVTEPISANRAPSQADIIITSLLLNKAT